MKKRFEHVRTPSVIRSQNADAENDISIGDVLRKARRDMITSQIIKAIFVVVLVSVIICLFITGVVDRLMDYLLAFVE
ncbi:MAG TPA: hypothetical protein PKV44_01980 [Bacillota bacterium]|nr:hypothetical protein [Bacillota bacterium]HPE39307.1 hypothetical protein [Bacillota bacterium]